MGAFRNGFIPTDRLIRFGEGTDGWNGEDRWEHLLSPASYRRHQALLTRAYKRTGRLLVIRPGYNAYRPFWVQTLAREKYGNGAATPGTSSHGGFWEGRDTLAVDYGNWGEVYGWDRAAFYADCRAVGLTPGLISPERGYPDEPWHVVDLDPWGAVPSGLDVSFFEQEEDPVPDKFGFVDDRTRTLERGVWQNVYLNEKNHTSFVRGKCVGMTTLTVQLRGLPKGAEVQFRLLRTKAGTNEERWGSTAREAIGSAGTTFAPATETFELTAPDDGLRWQYAVLADDVNVVRTEVTGLVWEP